MPKGRLFLATQQLGYIEHILRGADNVRRNDSNQLAGAARWYSDELDRVYWRAFDHCATLVRAYSTFERFVHEVVTEWLQWCMLYHPSLLLSSDRARISYELGTAEILKWKSNARFSDIDIRRITEGLNFFYDDAPARASLPVEPFLATQPNLKVPVIQTLFQNVELLSPIDWIKNYDPLRELCEAEGFGIETELNEIVERRNEAAHGNGVPADILGTNELLSRLEFLKLTCSAIHEFAMMRVCQLECGQDYAKGLLGRVTRVWRKRGAFELTTMEFPVRVGMPVVLLGPSSCVFSAINSIQLEGKVRRRFGGIRGTALGIMTDYLPAQGINVVDAAKIRGLPPLLWIGVSG